jgi:HAD superfamily hydrolase (TIGR01549 family)
MIKAVFFDVGETLICETEHWGHWADVLGISRLTFFAALGLVIERNWHHRKVFEVLGTTYQDAILERQRRGIAPREIQSTDFYADTIPCLTQLQAAGIQVGISGNQPEQAEKMLRQLELPLEYLASSASWGVEKPDLEFFKRIIKITNLEPHKIAYVGDRLDNDVLPAKAIGMKAIFLERGPWGVIHAQRPEVSQADLHLHSLEHLLERIR